MIGVSSAENGVLTATAFPGGTSRHGRGSEGRRKETV